MGLNQLTGAVPGWGCESLSTTHDQEMCFLVADEWSMGCVGHDHSYRFRIQRMVIKPFWGWIYINTLMVGVIHYMISDVDWL